MADELQNKLVTALTSLRDQGKTPTQAVEHMIQTLGGHYHDISRISVLNANVIADVLYTVYQGKIVAHELAVLLRNMCYGGPDIALALRSTFTMLDAQAIGALLLDTQVYPESEKQQVHHALHYAKFAVPECDRAVEALYSA